MRYYIYIYISFSILCIIYEVKSARSFVLKENIKKIESQTLNSNENPKFLSAKILNFFQPFLREKKTRAARIRIERREEYKEINNT